MLSMHIHFISSGEHIHDTFPTTLKSLDPIDHVAIVAEESIFHKYPDDSEFDKDTKPKIRASIEQVCEICKLMKVNCDVVRPPDTTLESVRDSLLPFAVNQQDANFSFNLSGGTKMLTLSLFTLALWLDGDVYLTPRSGNFEHVSIPKMHLNDLRKNPNHPKVLHFLGQSSNGQQESLPEGTWKRGPDLRQYIEKNYEPVKFPGDKKTDKVVTKGTI